MSTLCGSALLISGSEPIAHYITFRKIPTLDWSVKIIYLEMSVQRRLEHLSGLLVNSTVAPSPSLADWLVHDNQALRKQILDFLKVRAAGYYCTRNATEENTPL